MRNEFKRRDTAQAWLIIVAAHGLDSKKFRET